MHFLRTISSLAVLVVQADAFRTADKGVPNQPKSPWSKNSPLCFGTKEYLDYYKCDKGSSGYKAPLDDGTKPRSAKGMKVPSNFDQGFETLSRNESYLLLAESGKGVCGELFSLLLDGSKDLLSLAFPQLSLVFGWIAKSINLVFPRPTPSSIDLKPYFDRFEKRLNMQQFQSILDEIRTKYAVFVAWFQEMQDVQYSESSKRSVLERHLGRAEMIEMQLDLAGTLFTRKFPVDSGMAAYYLFEPLFNHASLHTQVILLRVAYLSSLGDVAAARRYLGHAKLKHDYYRQHLAAMRKPALSWRVSMVTAHGKPFSATSLCRGQFENKGTSYTRKTWTATYQWADTFYNSRSYQRQEVMTLEKTTMTGTSWKTYCNLEGELTDGRDMLREAERYRSDLNSVLAHHFEKILTMYDAVWTEFPPCLPGFRLVNDFTPDVSCKVAATVDDIKLHFGLMSNGDGTHWPRHAPVLDPARYLACQKAAADPLQGSAVGSMAQLVGQACFREADPHIEGEPPVPPGTEGTTTAPIDARMSDLEHRMENIEKRVTNIDQRIESDSKSDWRTIFGLGLNRTK